MQFSQQSETQFETNYFEFATRQLISVINSLCKFEANILVLTVTADKTVIEVFDAYAY